MPFFLLAFVNKKEFNPLEQDASSREL